MSTLTSRIVGAGLTLASIGLVSALATLGASPAGAAGAPTRQSPQTSQQPRAPSFSVSITAVPIDVRVIDRRTGKPITDLKQGDFTILEDGVRQEIRHFQLQTFTADDAVAAASPESAARMLPPAVRESPLSLVPQRSRVFLFVLANGRLQGGPVKGLDAAITFVRTRLLPQDHVAVFGYNRATDFTLDHEKVAQVIERFRSENDTIAAGVDHQLAGVTGAYGVLPEYVQNRIDYVFSGTDKMPFRTSALAENALTGGRTATDQQKAEAAAKDAFVAAGRMSAVSLDDPIGGSAARGSGSTSGDFASFVAANARTAQDMGNLYAAIAYMQKLEGEKHLVFVTSSSFSLGRGDDYKDISSEAANARIVLDILQTGQSTNVLDNTLLKGLAEDTGGTATIAEAAEAGLDRLDAATRVSYLLGYYPRNPTWDGSERTVTVKVNRPGVDVSYRRSYRADKTLPSFDRRAYTTRFRVAAAMQLRDEIKDIRVRLNVAGAKVGGERGVAIDARIDSSRLFFERQGGLQVGRIDIAVVFMNERNETIGGTYKKQTAHLEYDAASYAEAMKDGVPYQVQMRVPSGTRYIRLIVYDYMADLLGTAGAWLNQ